MRKLVLVVAMLGAGCAGTTRTGLPLPAEPVAVTPRAGASLPVTRSYSEIVVRTFLRDEENRRREVGGATCRVDAPAFAAEIRSPARVLVPVPRAGAPALDVTCIAGELSGAARRGIVREPRDPFWNDPFWPSPWGDPFWRPWPGDPYWDRRSGVSVGVGIGTGPGWGRWPRRGGAYYPDVEVELR
jgi:hypothetical protein